MMSSQTAQSIQGVHSMETLVCIQTKFFSLRVFGESLTLDNQLLIQFYPEDQQCSRILEDVCKEMLIN